MGLSLALAATWNPRGELGRLQRLLPQLAQVYAHMVITLPPHADPQAPAALAEAPFNLQALVSPEWPWGRYLALKSAVEAGQVGHVQYADLDRLLRWVETRSDEWRTTAALIEQADCTIIGRTSQAYATHPQALVRTEEISNRVTSFLLGKARVLDVSAGSKAFSRRAAEYLVAHSGPRRALGADAEWPVLLHQAGFEVEYIEVDGLDWESADRYRQQAAGVEEQRRAAAVYDADPQNWDARVGVALEIVQSGLEAARRAG